MRWVLIGVVAACHLRLGCDCSGNKPMIPFQCPTVVLSDTDGGSLTTLDGGTSAGADGGTPDGGTPDGGTPDGGTPDGGTAGGSDGGALVCPGGYILVPGNPTYGTVDFCVMKYEARLQYDGILEFDGNSDHDPLHDFDVQYESASQASFRPVSIPNGVPWSWIRRGINQGTSSRQGAIEACNLLGPGHALVNNAEWQTIARNIEAQPANWALSGGEVILSHGNSDKNPSNGCDSLQEWVRTNCANSGLESSHSERRTHQLSNGAILWDFAGNLWEWVSDNNSTQHYGGQLSYWAQFTGSMATQTLFGPISLAPATCTQPASGWFCGFGRITDGTGGAILRGADFTYGSAAGIFTVYMTRGPDYEDLDTGFRCVFHGP